MKKQAGFTIVELVVVIALLGILAAVALPRFLNVTDDAHVASVSGTGGAFSSAVKLVKAQAVVGEASGSVSYDGVSVTINSSQYPEATNAATCVSTWENVLQSSAPTVSDKTADKPDYLVTFASSACTYTYQKNTAFNIAYTPASGSVDIDTTL